MRDDPHQRRRSGCRGRSGLDLDAASTLHPSGRSFPAVAWSSSSKEADDHDGPIHRASGDSPLTLQLQLQHSLLSRESEWEVVPAALHNDIGLLPWSPLAGGFLTGKYQRGDVPASDSRAGSEKHLYQWVSAEYAAPDRNWANDGAQAPGPLLEGGSDHPLGRV
ncbi:aldo/keto reductase [Streptomyces sp. NPDC006372]|uniref:aldo/keto reductase n=1 Tax=Streptomyces sp. NPDC006372 TaxID=3155599 RepID=UPI0033B2B617